MWKVRSLFRLLVVLGACSVCLQLNSAAMAHPAADTGAAGAAAHPEGASGEAPGPPMEFTADLALWSAVVFVIFLFVLHRFAWGPMIEGLDKREAGIKQAIADAEDNRRKSQALLAEYDQKLKQAEETVQQMVAEARRDAERTSQDLISSTQKEVQLIRDRAKDDIQQAKDTALAEVFTSVNRQVIRATEHVLGRALNDGDQDRLVEEALAGVGR
jgi:F-type H+-transporting ATPase subunit b